MIDLGQLPAIGIPAKPDADIAAAVKAATEQLNAALSYAHSAGLAVTVDTRELSYHGARHPQMIVLCMVMRPL